MISEEHQLALHLRQIRREETICKQRASNDEPFETFWIKQAIKLIEIHKQKWEKQAVEFYKHTHESKRVSKIIADNIKIKCKK